MIIANEYGLSRHAMVWDAQLGAFLMFGGNRNPNGLTDQTLVLDELTAPPAFALYGNGCAGSAPQAPRLQADPLWNAVPILGGVFFVRIDLLPASQLTFGLIGFSDQTWNNQPLPLDLTSVGMPGCHLLLAPAATVGLGFASSGGVASWTTPIPNQLPLLGVQFLQQALVLAPGANPAGLLWSNGGRGTIGLR
jgi:hypothetical protein